MGFIIIAGAWLNKLAGGAQGRIGWQYQSCEPWPWCTAAHLHLPFAPIGPSLVASQTRMGGSSLNTLTIFNTSPARLYTLHHLIPACINYITLASKHVLRMPKQLSVLTLYKWTFSGTSSAHVKTFWRQFFGGRITLKKFTTIPVIFSEVVTHADTCTYNLALTQGITCGALKNGGLLHNIHMM